MKKYNIIIFLFLALIFSNISYSQVTAVLLQPPPFRFNATDLWRVTLTNTGAPQSIYMRAIAKKNGVVLVEATSSIFTLQTSLAPRLVNASSISPIDLKKNSNEIDDAFRTTGSLPSGKYNICIYVYAAGTNMLLSEYCNDYEVLKSVKGELISPRDEEEIRSMFPIFNWMPPSPITPGNMVTYEINIVEILERQTAYYAMSSNPFIYSKKSITTGIFQYPVAALPLENNRRYAWRVKTYLNGGFLSESEVREFTYNGKTVSAKDFNADVRSKFKNDRDHFIEMPLLITPKKRSQSGDWELGLRGSNEWLTGIGSGEEGTGSPIKTFGETYRKEIQKSPFKFSGSYNISGKMTNRQKTGSQIPKSLLSIEADPTLSIYDLPFTLALYFDTQQKDDKQHINSAAFLFDPSKLKDIIRNKIDEKKAEIEKQLKDKSQEEINAAKDKAGNSVGGLLKFFSNFKTLGLGETYPTYSKYILSGTKVTGLDLEFNPSWLYLAVSGLKNLDAIDSVSFGRKLFAGKIGYGEKDKSHFHLTFMKAKDDINSLDVNDTLKVTTSMSPGENVIVGSDGKLNLFKDRISIKGEVSGSVITDDLRAPDLSSDDIPEFARSIISIKMGTHYDLMYNIESTVNIPESNTKLTGGYKFIGLGYSSFGAPSITNGVKGFKAGVEQYFADKKMNVKFSTEQLTSSKTNMDKHRYDFGLSMFFEDAPYVIVNYTPYSESNSAIIDSLKIDNSASAFSITTGINLPVKSSTLGSMISISTQSNESKKRIGDYSIFNLLLNETMSFDSPFSISAGANFTKINSALADSLAPANTSTFDLSATMTLLKTWNNTLSFSYQKTAGQNSNIVLGLNSTVPVFNIGNLSVNLMKNFYREEFFQEGENNDIIFRATMTKSW
ncbi:hypothetical protein BH10BAC5_BH10BAC5_02980 [soil metagenome]